MNSKFNKRIDFCCSHMSSLSKFYGFHIPFLKFNCRKFHEISGFRFSNIFNILPITTKTAVITRRKMLVANDREFRPSNHFIQIILRLKHNWFLIAIYWNWLGLYFFNWTDKESTFWVTGIEQTTDFLHRNQNFVLLTMTFKYFTYLRIGYILFLNWAFSFYVIGGIDTCNSKDSLFILVLCSVVSKMVVN